MAEEEQDVMARLRSLVEKLGHPLPDIKRRALRNLRLKMATGLVSDRFLEDPASELFTRLKALIEGRPEPDPEAQREALALLAEVCQRGLDGAKAR
jgi:hypothetical protein